MQKSAGQAWFRPKTYGYGASPASWQGWLVTAIFIVLLNLAVLTLHGSLRWVIGAVLTGGFVVLVYSKTDGEWRWRP